MSKNSVTKFDLEAAFKALNEVDYAESEKGLVARRQNLKESYSNLRENKQVTDILLEDYYDLEDTEDLTDAAEDREGEVAQAKLARIEKIVDLDAKTADELLPSYVGKVIIQCPQCMNLFYKDEADIEKDEEDPTTCNINEPCQHCGNISGYTLIGKVDAVDDTEAAELTGNTDEEPDALDLDLDFDVEEETTEDDTEAADAEVEETEEDVEEADEDLDLDLDLNLESLNNSKALKDASKNTDLDTDHHSDNLTLNEGVDADLAEGYGDGTYIIYVTDANGKSTEEKIVGSLADVKKKIEAAKKADPEEVFVSKLENGKETPLDNLTYLKHEIEVDESLNNSKALKDASAKTDLDTDHHSKNLTLNEAANDDTDYYKGFIEDACYFINDDGYFDIYGTDLTTKANDIIAAFDAFIADKKYGKAAKAKKTAADLEVVDIPDGKRIQIKGIKVEEGYEAQLPEETQVEGCCTKEACCKTDEGCCKKSVTEGARSVLANFEASLDDEVGVVKAEESINASENETEITPEDESENKTINESLNEAVAITISVDEIEDTVMANEPCDSMIINAEPAGTAVYTPATPDFFCDFEDDAEFAPVDTIAPVVAPEVEAEIADDVAATVDPEAKVDAPETEEAAEETKNEEDDSDDDDDDDDNNEGGSSNVEEAAGKPLSKTAKTPAQARQARQAAKANSMAKTTNNAERRSRAHDILNDLARKFANFDDEPAVDENLAEVLQEEVNEGLDAVTKTTLDEFDDLNKKLYNDMGIKEVTEDLESATEDAIAALDELNAETSPEGAEEVADNAQVADATKEAEAETEAPVDEALTDKSTFKQMLDSPVFQEFNEEVKETEESLVNKEAEQYVDHFSSENRTVNEEEEINLEDETLTEGVLDTIKRKFGDIKSAIKNKSVKAFTSNLEGTFTVTVTGGAAKQFYDFGSAINEASNLSNLPENKNKTIVISLKHADGQNFDRLVQYRNGKVTLDKVQDAVKAVKAKGKVEASDAENVAQPQVDTNANVEADNKKDSVNLDTAAKQKAINIVKDKLKVLGIDLKGNYDEATNLALVELKAEIKDANTTKDELEAKFKAVVDAFNAAKGKPATAKKSEASVDSEESSTNETPAANAESDGNKFDSLKKWFIDTIKEIMASNLSPEQKEQKLNALNDKTDGQQLPAPQDQALDAAIDKAKDKVHNETDDSATAEANSDTITIAGQKLSKESVKKVLEGNATNLMPLLKKLTTSKDESAQNLLSAIAKLATDNYHGKLNNSLMISSVGSLIEAFINESEEQPLDLNDFEECDEIALEECLQESLTNVYENIRTFNVIDCSIDAGKFIVEGLISFKSGATRETKYVFTEATKLGDTVKLTGSNNMLASDGKFVLEGKLAEGNNLITESFSYKYHVGTELVEGLVRK